MADRFVIERDGQRASLVPVPDESVAASVALELIDEGAELTELCGGFGLAETARVVEAVDGRVPVGYVNFALKELSGCASCYPCTYTRRRKRNSLQCSIIPNVEEGLFRDI